MKKRLIPVIILAVFSAIYVLFREAFLVYRLYNAVLDWIHYPQNPWFGLYDVLGCLLSMLMLLFIPLFAVGILKWKGFSLALIPVWLYAVCSLLVSFFSLMGQIVYYGDIGGNVLNIVTWLSLLLLSSLCLLLTVATIILVNPFKKEANPKFIKPGPTTIVPKDIEEHRKAAISLEKNPEPGK